MSNVVSLGEAGWDKAEAEWEAKVETTVARMEALALVRVFRLAVEHRQRELRAAEYEVQLAIERARAVKNTLEQTVDVLEDAIRLASRHG